MHSNTNSPILFILTLVCAAFGEPQCSPFHYQEQMLEKVVEMKFQMKVWEEKMGKLELLVKGSVAHLEETLKKSEDLETKLGDTREQLKDTINKTLDSSINGMKTVVTEGINRINNVINENEKLETRLQEVIVAQTSSLNASLEGQSKAITELENILTEDAKTPVVMFKARDVKDKSPSDGDTVIFKTIVQNEGSGYNPSTGIFTAPAAGTYLFTVQFCLYSGKAMSFKVVAGGLPITAAYFYEQSYSYVCASSDGFATLKQGDDVKVVVTAAPSGSAIHPDYGLRNWSYFSGVLLHT